MLTHKEDRQSLGLSQCDINPPLYMKCKCNGELKNNAVLLDCMETKKQHFQKRFRTKSPKTSGQWFSDVLKFCLNLSFGVSIPFRLSRW